VSGTGEGEFYIRQVVAYDICAMVHYQHKTLAQAVHEEIHEKLKRSGGYGGVIAMDPSGNIVMDFNSPGMFRAARDSRGRREIGMYGDMQ
jgi:beta-aspartyl-peptidase (threonine type)